MKTRSRQIITGVCGFIFVLVAVMLAWIKPHLAAVWIIAIILWALHPRLNDLVEISFGSIKAKLEKNLSDSENLLQGLREFSALLARVGVSVSVTSSRLGGPDPLWQYASVREIERGLKVIGLADDEIRKVRKDFVAYAVADAGCRALGGMRSAYCEREGFLPSVSILQSCSDPEKIEIFLRERDALSPPQCLLIADMRWMIENEDVRDEAQYQRTRSGVGNGQ